MRWLVSSGVCLLLAGCSMGGLQRDYYPEASPAVLATGRVIHTQPYEAEASESGWSRAGKGLLAAGVVGLAAGLADSNLSENQAYSYMVETDDGESLLINSAMHVETGSCISVLQARNAEFFSLEKRLDEDCQRHDQRVSSDG